MEITTQEKNAHNKSVVLNNLVKLMPYAGLIFVTLVFWFLSDGLLLSARNIRMIIIQLFPILMISSGAVFVYSQGAMDVSVGAVLGVTALTSALVINSTGSFTLAIVVSIMTALVFAFANGYVSAKLGIHPVMTSLCVMFIGRGIVTMGTTDPPTIYVDVDFGMANATFFKAAVLILFILIMTYIFKFTKIGKYVRAIGGNKLCSLQSGINISKYQVLGYTTMAFGIAIAGFFVLARTGSVTRGAGVGMEMDVLLALIFGGMPLEGGSRAKMSCAVIGSITYVLLGNGLLLSGIDVEVVSLVRGILFLLVIFLSVKKSRGILPR